MMGLGVAKQPDKPEAENDLVEPLRALGIPEQAISRALDRGDPEGAIFDAVLMPARAERTVTLAEIERRGGLTVAESQAFIEAYGLRAPGPDEPAFTQEEAVVFVELGQLQDIWPPELGIQLARVYGRLLARIAQTEVQLFRLFVEPRLRGDDPDRLGGLRAIQSAFARLLPLADPLLLGVHQRWLEHELAQVAVSEAETHAGAEALPGTVDVAFLFCDLKDFTAFAQSEGDGAAVSAIDRFADRVAHERGEQFRMMKALGDGFMLAYGDAGTAVAAGARIIKSMREPSLPGVHASVHHGPAIAREGDYFGSSVNLAARLLGAAGRDELVATRPVVDRCDDFAWEPAGARKVRGVAEPVDIFRLRLEP
jgi:adenylate cyclase